MSDAPLLVIDGLRVAFGRGERQTTALDGVSLELAAGEVLGLVGETGCGKTLTGLSVLRLLPPGASVLGGSIHFEGADVLTLPDRQVRALRGSRVAMIFQNPVSAFNPVFSVGWQIEQVMRRHLDLNGAARRARLAEVLHDVGLPDVERVAGAYPHQLSGGQLQRAMIAMALSCRPSLVIADEPTTSLDVTIAAQILALLSRLQAEYGFGVLFISHNLAVVRRICTRVAVLYAGRVVETGRSDELFGDPEHPYTRGLLRAIPTVGSRGAQLSAIEGVVPADPGRVTGCTFADRCPVVMPACRAARPPELALSPTHASACLRAGTLNDLMAPEAMA